MNYQQKNGFNASLFLTKLLYSFSTQVISTSFIVLLCSFGRLKGSVRMGTNCMESLVQFLKMSCVVDAFSFCFFVFKARMC